MAISIHNGPRATAPASNHKYDQDCALVEFGLWGIEVFASTLDVQLCKVKIRQKLNYYTVFYGQV